MPLEFDIEIYEKENGDCPFEVFVENNPKLKPKVLRDLELLRRFGNQLREPYSKSIGEGIFELRTIFGNDISRTLYFFYINRKIVITHGFVKKTKKTPRRELDKAIEYREDWIRRNGDGTK